MNLLKKLWRLLYAPANPLQKAIARLKLPAWQLELGHSDGVFLIDGTIPSPSYVVRMAMMARAYANVKRFIPLMVCNTSWSSGNPWKAIYRALGICQFTGFLQYRFNPWRTFLVAVRAWRLYRSIRSPEELLNATYNGIKIGDLIYDDVLRAGGCYTITKITPRIYIHIFKALFIFHFYTDLLARHPVKAATLSHTCYSTHGIPFRMLLKKGVPVINDIRKFTSFAQYPFVPEIPSAAMLDDIATTASGRLHLVNEELKSRFSETGFTGDLGTLYAYRGKRRVTPDVLRKELKLEGDLPIVTIFAHVFKDAAHYLGWFLYRDFYEWLVNTLRCVDTIPGVHWLLRPHPSASLYKEERAVPQLIKDMGLVNVRLLSEEYHALSVAEASHALVTCSGSCGAEYAHLGVPTILAGQTHYSHCGFTYNPRTKEEYYHLLRNVASLPRLSVDQMHRAKIYNFFKLVIMKSVFSDLFSRKTENVLGDYDGQRLRRMLNELYVNLQKYSPDDDSYYRRVIDLITTDREYLIDASDGVRADVAAL